MSEFTRREFLAGAIASVVAGQRSLAWLEGMLRRFPEAGTPADFESTLQDVVTARRQDYLDVLNRVYGLSTRRLTNRINPTDRTWEDWQKRTGELPPDFATMPGNAFLPDPLLLVENGRSVRIRSRQQWQRKRELIRSEMERWMMGKPYPAPAQVRGVVTDTRKEGDATRTLVRLEFGPDDKATLRLEILVPQGSGPFPVFLTNHLRSRPWVNTAVRRGYIGCIYRAIDQSYGVSDDTRAWVDLYPEYELGVIGRWAWAASRAIDYLVTLPSVDAKRIATGGHSRNAKQAMFAAAADERIGAVAPSRGNNGSEISWRHSSAPYLSESVADLARGFPDWYHPRLRFFSGREHKLPTDQNEIMALIAPRGLILSHAYHEHQGNAFGIEQSYRSLRSVYKLLGKEDNLALYQVPGEHPSTAEDVERYFDFFDSVFGRKAFPHMERFVHGYSYENWQRLSRDRIDLRAFPVRKPGDFLTRNGSPINTVEAWATQKEALRQQHNRIYGERPPGIPYPTGIQTGTTSTNGWVDQLFQRPKSGMPAISLPFGDDLKADLYLPKGLVNNNAGRATLLASKWPVVLWLHPYSYATGYSQFPDFWRYLTDIGVGVLAFDQIGFGNRNGQALEFYRRYPRWSLLSKMITDVRSVVGQLLSIPMVEKVYALGFSLGGKVALHAAAMDERISGVAAVSAFTPLRVDTPEKGTEGIRHYSHLHGLLPRMGAFLGQESRLPIDYDEILALIAPRPVLILSPLYDRFAHLPDVRQAVGDARNVYALMGAAEALTLDSPEGFDEFKGKTAYDWIDAVTSPRQPIPVTPAPPARVPPP